MPNAKEWVGKGDQLWTQLRRFATAQTTRSELAAAAGGATNRDSIIDFSRRKCHNDRATAKPSDRAASSA